MSSSGQRADSRPLSDNEQELLRRLLSDPFSFPLEFKQWLRNYLEISDVILPRSAIHGLDKAGRTPPLGWEDVGTGGGVAAPTTLNAIIDAVGGFITTGIKGDITVGHDCRITSWTLLADTSGSIVVDVWKDAYANFPPTAGDSITALAKPTLSSAAKATDSTLASWTTLVNAGDVLRFNVDSVSGLGRVDLALELAGS